MPYNFPNSDLEAVQRGEKRATLRVRRAPPRLRPGDLLTLQFGARHAPTTVRVLVQRVLSFDLTADLERFYEQEEEALNGDAAAAAAEDEQVAALTDEERRAAWLAEGVDPALLDALKETGNDYDGLLFECLDREAPFAVFVFWTL